MSTRSVSGTPPSGVPVESSLVPEDGGATTAPHGDQQTVDLADGIDPHGGPPGGDGYRARFTAMGPGGVVPLGAPDYGAPGGLAFGVGPESRVAVQDLVLDAGPDLFARVQAGFTALDLCVDHPR
jgi:hypothetical protein